MLFGMQETMIYKDVMIKGRRCPEIGCTETYAHCYTLDSKTDIILKPIYEELCEQKKLKLVKKRKTFSQIDDQKQYR